MNISRAPWKVGPKQLVGLRVRQQRTMPFPNPVRAHLDHLNV